MASASVDNNMQTSTALANDLVPVYLKEKLLQIAEKSTIFYDIGDKENLPEGNGKTIQFTRYERIPLAQSPVAAEGETPASTPLTASIVQAVVDQWAQLVTITDVAEMTVKHPVLRVAQQRLGMAHAELVDREIQKTLMGASNVTFANGRTARSSLTTGDNLATDDIRRIVSALRALGAPSYDTGGNFLGVFDPYVEMDLTKDSTFVNAAAYSNIKALYNGEVGTWMGVRWKRSNLIPVIASHANSGAGVTYGAQTSLSSFTGFTASSAVYAKVTKLDPNTGFETVIWNESAAITDGSAFLASIAIDGTNANTGAGVYNIYLTLEDGASGTETFQTRAIVTAASTTTVTIAAAIGSGTITATAIVVSATGAIAPPNASSSGNVHVSYVFGEESFGVTDLGGMKTTITPATPTDSDPLVQRRKVGWKQLFKAVIKNPDFFRRIESLSAFN